ncbi:N-acetyltransferase [Ruegeria pomeroyi]|uniref:N-acetyltransferase n=1 Tax=Ruegeria pomeroyi TaxID=89184 RepID=A0A9Q3ZL72_9RHOB|nr:N-acetyltransferase [Ruegeria pomeroyi]MCE8508237.1 N-acetyltransferase [Ruegeria pomeroyi]MCE8516033.1 N-acetyltransferase [Ruegeria pomeroyi]MCE8521842.1 N-acetyltransferase [Ruegeria pomeroyi]MCE8534462.1 N-acetyltransferase [Ruegeria pomeroyi]MCE8536683.1 N-acetyltransferase [Ruegeria pomeroyi]
MRPFPPAVFPDLVDALLRSAFDTGAEADLVRELRADRDIATEITFQEFGELLGYAALSWMRAPDGWLCLAPLAVAPKAQGRGIGSKVLQLTLKWAAERDLTIVVLGDPAYYEPRGFSRARASALHAPYPNDHLMLAGPGGNVPEARLVYPLALEPR